MARKKYNSMLNIIAKNFILALAIVLCVNGGLGILCGIYTGFFTQDYQLGIFLMLIGYILLQVASHLVNMEPKEK